MVETPNHPRVDALGNPLRVGDIVRVIGVPSEGLSAESKPVFERLVGSYRRIRDFDEYGYVELEITFRGGPDAGMHWVWLEPWLVRRKGVRPRSRAAKPARSRAGGGERASSRRKAGS